MARVGRKVRGEEYALFSSYGGAAALMLLGFGATVVSAQPSMKGALTPLAAAPFAQDADVACLQAALETGDPGSGPRRWS